MTELDDPLILALDYETADEARSLVDALGSDANFYKVGMELYAAAGMDIVRELVNQGKQVFLDLKLYDIGETVRRAVVQVARSGATFLTIHAHPAIMRAAAEGRQSSDLKLLAVTVLTSFDESDLREDGCQYSVHELVSLRVRKALEFGMDGVIASPLEAVSIRAQAGPNLILATPGVRSRGAGTGDQKRVATPAEALRDGANYLVIGRQVTRSEDPVAALRAIRDEIAHR
jgi:orotidine-5'-phosphate decarboxylase